MTHKANPTLIGAFVVGATALLVAAVLVFGSGKIFTKRHEYILFFPGSVAGLNVGSPVKFRGVDIGSVKGIKVALVRENLSFYIPVLIEILPDKILTVSNRHKIHVVQNLEIFERDLDYLIQKGLRAQLQNISFVTGQVAVEMDFYPDTPINLIEMDLQYPQIPTIPSTMEKLSNVLENVPFEEISKKVISTLDGIERLANNQELVESITHLKDSLAGLKKLVARLDAQVVPLASSLKGTSDAAQALVKRLDVQVDPVAERLMKTLDQANLLLENVKKTTSPTAHFQQETLRAINELALAARSMRILFEYLENHPEALLRGKRPSGGER